MTAITRENDQFVRRFNWKGRLSKWKSIPWREKIAGFDLPLFYLLFLFVLLFQFQVVFPRLANWRLREVLLVYLYVRAWFFYPIPLNRYFLMIVTYLLCTFMIAVHTVARDGEMVALFGFSRFASVALLAPLAGIFLTDKKQVRTLMKIWLCVLGAAAGTAIFQGLGGKIPALVQNYHSARGFLARYMTLIGEPNIGGMASAIGLAFAAFWMRKNSNKWIVLSVSIILAVMSVSKAALLGLMISSIVVFASEPQVIMKTMVVVKVAVKKALEQNLRKQVILILILAGLIAQTAIAIKIPEYLVTMFEGFAGMNRDGGGIFDDIFRRLILLPGQGVQALVESPTPVFHFLCGKGFGFAGSAAEEFNPRAFMPHNGFVEIYLLGGAIFISVFVTLLVFTAVKLCRIAIVDRTYLALFGAFWLLLFFNFTYPIIYTPFLGSLFWVIVGVTASRIDWKSS